jgi:hypothetical protein
MARYSRATFERTEYMSDRNQNDTDATVQLPKLPVDADDYDPEKTIVVEDWSQVAMPVAPESKRR